MQPEAVVPALDAHLDHARGDPGLDAVVHGVFHQRLQKHRRDQGLLDGRLQLPSHREPLAQAQLLEVQILPAQRQLILERDQLAVVGHHGAEQLREVFQRGFGALRLLANQRKHRVQAVEEEMRADAGLERLQARLGDRRREGAVAQMEVPREHSRPQRGVAEAPGKLAPTAASA